jgi:hypothetical protein
VPHEISVDVSMPLDWQAGAVLTGVGMMSVTLNDVANTSDCFRIESFTATATGTNAGLYDQIIRTISDPTVWVQECIKKLIGLVGWVLMSPSLRHWTEHEWTRFLEWLRHVEIALIHLTPTGFH